MTYTALVRSSDMTEREFGVVFSRLAIQLRFTDADVLTVRAYYDALKDIPLVAVETSGRAFATEPGRKFFPTTAEWHDAAQRAVTDELRKVLAPARDESWKLECGACEDTGWESFHCPGDESCGRTTKHTEHTYVRICTCRPNNRTYQRHQKFGGGA